AGKTTTVEILEGYRSRTAGDVKVLGHDPEARERSFRESIGIVLQETGVEPFLTVAEVIEQYRGYYPRPRPLDEIIEVVGLQEKRDSRVSKLSGGQKRRLDVAVGLAGDPELLFLDEPTTGFDPSARRNAWDMVKNLQALDKTVLLTTHYMDEAQQLADRVGIIRSGRIIAEGPPSQLVGEAAAITHIAFVLPPGETLPAAFEDAVHRGDAVDIPTGQPVAVLNQLTGWALERKIELQNLSVTRPTLEDVYLDLTATDEAGT
ncbi:MAG: ABC transporter ATP-binding protein, partial [Actinomycetota bacterium]|nr:ABC transporter ATP-binding protein [Actinomycetota bacterium]